MELPKARLMNGVSPKYIQIKEFLLEHIRNNSLQAGDLVPSENELAESFGVTPVTASKAVNELVNEDILYRIRGKGTFIKTLTEQSPPVFLYVRGNPSNDPYFSSPLFTMIANRLALHGLSLTVKYINGGYPRQIPSADNKSGVSIVQELHTFDRFSKELLSSIQIPVIIIGAHPEEPFDCVSFDNRQGISQAIKHLAELGHTRIAFFSATADNISNRERINGYKLSIEKHGLVKDDSLVFPGIYSKESGYKSAGLLLKMEKRPTAVICSSDVIAVGALEMFRKSGLRIPEDVSIVGFGDYEIASYTIPSLTTVCLPIEKMGEQVVKLTLDRIKTPAAMRLQRVSIPTNLIVRHSTGKPPESTEVMSKNSCIR